MAPLIARLLAHLLIVGTVACGPGDLPSFQSQQPSEVVRQPLEDGRPIEVLREHRTLGGPDDFALLVGFAVIDDSYLLVGDATGDFHLAVVDIESGEVTARFGRDGDGPREFRGPFSILPDPNLSAIWWVYDFATWQLTPVTMENSRHDWSIGDRYSLVGLPRVPETVIWTGPRQAIVHGMFSEFAVAQVTLSEEGRFVADWTAINDPQPFTLEDVPHNPGLSMMNRSSVAVRPDGDRFALAYQFDNWIEVRDGNGQLIRKIDGPREVMPNYRVDENGRFHLEDDSEDGYVRAYGTEQGFYLLWCGAPGAIAPCPGMAIHHYDWDGNFLREFWIESMLLDFAVSAAGDRLWGYMPSRVPPLIGEWIIPEH